jgi:hypothetical protein
MDSVIVRKVYEASTFAGTKLNVGDYVEVKYLEQYTRKENSVRGTVGNTYNPKELRVDTDVKYESDGLSRAVFLPFADILEIIRA